MRLALIFFFPAVFLFGELSALADFKVYELPPLISQPTAISESGAVLGNRAAFDFKSGLKQYISRSGFPDWKAEGGTLTSFTKSGAPAGFLLTNVGSHGSCEEYSSYFGPDTPYKKISTPFAIQGDSAAGRCGGCRTAPIDYSYPCMIVNGTIVSLRTDPNSVFESGSAYDLNKDGVAVGMLDEQLGGTDRGFRYEAGSGHTFIDPLPDTVVSIPTAISNDGWIVGRSEKTFEQTTAFLLKPGELIRSLEISGVTSSRANDINSTHQIVGRFTNTNGETRAFISDADGIPVDLDSLLPSSSAWTISDALTINDRGDIAAIGKLSRDPLPRAVVISERPFPVYSYAYLAPYGTCFTERVIDANSISSSGYETTRVASNCAAKVLLEVRRSDGKATGRVEVELQSAPLTYSTGNGSYLSGRYQRVWRGRLGASGRKLVGINISAASSWRVIIRGEKRSIPSIPLFVQMNNPA